MGQRRFSRDSAQAAVVNRGIAMLETSGRGAAAKYLMDQRVPFRVIVRVLAEPDRRRQAD